MSAAIASWCATARRVSFFLPAMPPRWRGRSRRYWRGARNGRAFLRRPGDSSRLNAPGSAALAATRGSTSRCSARIPSPARCSRRTSMCGIYGMLHLSGASAAPEALRPMARRTIHRGPDDEGVYADGPLTFGMRRLSIIDVAGGHQPLSNEDGTLWLIANGEIYNYQALRRELTGQGHHFKTASDCETILHLYEQHGEAFVEHLNGMFAFALWDARRQRLLLGRDRLG